MNKTIQEILNKKLQERGNKFGNFQNGCRCVLKKVEREEILIRDRNICQWCMKKKRDKNLHVHHIDLDECNHLVNNLITLCKDCHRRFHMLARKN